MWNQDFEEIKENEIITLSARASSELPIEYIVTEGSNNIEINEDKAKILNPGVISISAIQNGNEIYEPAQPVVKVFEALSSITSVNTEIVKFMKFGENLQILNKPLDSKVTIYRTDGSLIYEGYDSTIKLSNASEYIIKVCDRIYKVCF